MEEKLCNWLLLFEKYNDCKLAVLTEQIKGEIMKKNKKIIIISIIELVLIVFLGYILYSKVYVPNKKDTEFKDSIKNISVNNVNQIINDYQTEKEKEELLASIPEINNGLLNETNWINYSDNNVIAFSDDYFVWYKDSKLTSDNAMIGQFSYYKGEKAFNLISNYLDEDAERSENDSVLILNVLSNKEDGEETLESSQTIYLLGYNSGNLMTYIDISSYKEHSFVKIDNDTTTNENSDSSQIIENENVGTSEE